MNAENKPAGSVYSEFVHHHIVGRLIERDARR